MISLSLSLSSYLLRRTMISLSLFLPVKEDDDLSLSLFLPVKEDDDLSLPPLLLLRKEDSSSLLPLRGKEEHLSLLPFFYCRLRWKISLSTFWGTRVADSLSFSLSPPSGDAESPNFLTRSVVLSLLFIPPHLLL